ncbi:hypothetical protein AGMMS49938_15690 [Fibrobacterales bacterium]|nr:hypothetical protein AGMMS49938_15690 [Fibrobacterales bacterium]
MSIFNTFSKSVRGASHEKNKKECQDSSRIFETGNFAVAITADGHGDDACFRSEVGAKFAVETAEEVLKSAILEIEKERDMNIFLTAIKVKIINKWQEKVKEHLKHNPISKQNAVDFKPYGTTLIIVASSQELWFALQIGDGICVVLDNTVGIPQMVFNDDSQMLGDTHSLCEKNAQSNFKHKFGISPLFGAFAATDGVQNSLAEDYLLYGFAPNLFRDLNSKLEEAKNDLENFVLPNLSQKGGDDVSISCFVNTAKFGECNFNFLDKNSKMKGENKNLKNENINLKNEMLQKEREIINLLDENKNIEQCIIETKKELGKVQSELINTSGNLSVTNKKLLEVKDKLLQTKNELSLKENEIADMCTGKDKLLKLTTVLANERIEKDKIIENLKAELDKKIAELERTNEENAKFRYLAFGLYRKITILETDCQATQKLGDEL